VGERISESRFMTETLVAALSIAVYALPIGFVVLKVLKAPLRIWYPLLAFAAVMIAIRVFDELGGSEIVLAMMYYFAGAY
jgi:hypothetical protein